MGGSCRAGFVRQAQDPPNRNPEDGSQSSDEPDLSGDSSFSAGERTPLLGARGDELVLHLAFASDLQSIEEGIGRIIQGGINVDQAALFVNVLGPRRGLKRRVHFRDFRGEFLFVLMKCRYEVAHAD